MPSNAGKYIANSLEKNLHVSAKYLPGVLSNPGERSLHKIRVAIKKINAAYRLLEFLIPDGFSRKKHYRKFEKIFDSLGKLRELQLNDSYMESCHLPAASQKMYAAFYASERNKAQRKNKEALKKFDVNFLFKSTKQVNKLTRNLKDDGVLQKTKQFILAEANQIKKLLKDYDNPDKVHKIRKFLKELNYNAKFLNNIKPSEKAEQLIIRLKEAETLIGTWHDKVALIYYIQKLTEKNNDAKPASIKPFNKIIARLSGENKNTLSQLKPKLEKMMAKLNSRSL